MNKSLEPLRAAVIELAKQKDIEPIWFGTYGSVNWMSKQHIEKCNYFRGPNEDFKAPPLDKFYTYALRRCAAADLLNLLRDLSEAQGLVDEGDVISVPSYRVADILS